nr:immunoglobulin light chain junction region [Macaca mulatta]MOW15232.1 immunoglobulin light chain junction region [Macaca mulatta]MOW15235.1 immunoglobulin light chain junction region [Macaca mulatta]MOW15316.1 immunoglobulin light chain junction region [Macaca mulatta]MOW15356.1 immunoglobulin light chain junction region [Macaca mulatta]
DYYCCSYTTSGTWIF